MTINKEINGNELYIAPAGRLDTTTAPVLETELSEKPDTVNSIVIDMKELVYVSSAGLRVLLSTQKKMGDNGTLVIKNVCDSVYEIFEITGFTDILTIEK